MLALDIAFPAGRYYAARADEPDLPEWPPHPSRVFSALVAAAAEKGLSGSERAALEWLERQAPPSMEAPPADQERISPISYVPPGDFNSQQGRNEHPCHRIRKDRSFPAAYMLGKPVVRYIWDGTPSSEIQASLDDIARRMTHVGTSHSMVVARVTNVDIASPVWCPSRNGGEFLRVPLAGRLDELETIYGNTLNVRRPPSAFEPLVAYRTDGKEEVLDNPVFGELLCFRLSGITYDLSSWERLARALRTAIMSQLQNPIPDAIHGHWDGHHVAWLPLADVRPPREQKAAYARGRILGVGIAVPRTMGGDDRHRTLEAIGRIQGNGIHLPGAPDIGFSSLPLGQRQPRALTASTWLGASRKWATVTPVVPDRLPKKDKSPLIEQSIVDSLKRAGLPAPVELEVSRYSRYQGAPSTMDYRMPVPRFHAVVQFPRPIRGPVTAGRLRYFGIGLFRPLMEGE